MAMSRQQLLQEAWLGGREGDISGQTQEPGHGYGMLTHVASKLYTITPSRRKQEHPSPSALSQLFDKI